MTFKRRPFVWCQPASSASNPTLLANRFDDDAVAMLLKTREEKPSLVSLCGLQKRQTEANFHGQGLAVSGQVWLVLLDSGLDVWLVLVSLVGSAVFWSLLVGSGWFWWVLVGSGWFWLLPMGSGGFWWFLKISDGVWWVLMGLWCALVVLVCFGELGWVLVSSGEFW